MTNVTHIVLSTATDLLRIRTSELIYIQSDGNYSTLILSGGEARVVTFQLGQIEKMLDGLFSENDKIFVRIGRSLIINLNYVYYINLTKQQLVLTDHREGRYTLSAAREALTQLKEVFEKTVK